MIAEQVTPGLMQQRWQDKAAMELTINGDPDWQGHLAGLAREPDPESWFSQFGIANPTELDDCRVWSHVHTLSLEAAAVSYLIDRGYQLEALEAAWPKVANRDGWECCTWSKVHLSYQKAVGKGVKPEHRNLVCSHWIDEDGSQREAHVLSPAKMGDRACNGQSYRPLLDGNLIIHSATFTMPGAP